jgi:hypothetical protein
MRRLTLYFLFGPLFFYGQSLIQLKGLEFLEINRSTLADVKKKLGTPSKEYKHQVSDREARFDKVLEYHDKKLTLHFDRKTSLLLVIDIATASITADNREVIIGRSDSSEVKEAFGVPTEKIWEKNLYGFSYLDTKKNDYSFFFDANAVIQRAIFASHEYTSRTIHSH